MSLLVMQNVLCRGVVDGGFLADLLEAPQQALAGYDLTADEHAVFTSAGATTLAELATAVEAWRRGELVPVRSISGATAAPRPLALAS